MLHKSLIHMLRRAVLHLIIIPSMLIESFLFYFKGKQERAEEKLVKIEGIGCLNKCSQISEIRVLYNFDRLNSTISRANLIFLRRIGKGTVRVVSKPGYKICLLLIKYFFMRIKGSKGVLIDC